MEVVREELRIDIHHSSNHSIYVQSIYDCLDALFLLANPTMLDGPLGFLVLGRLHPRRLWGYLFCIHLIQPTLVSLHILKDLSIIGFRFKVRKGKLFGKGLCRDCCHVCIDGILE